MLHCKNRDVGVYLKLDIKDWRLAFVTSLISQRYLCSILKQPDDYITPTMSDNTVAIYTDIYDSNTRIIYDLNVN